MIDIHSHILPGVDDGARTLGQALTMLRMAADDGVTVQALTPHINAMYKNRPEDLRAAFDRFVADASGIGVELRLAAEIAVSPEIPGMIAGERMPWVGAWEGRPAFLLEFPATLIPAGSLRLVGRLVASGVTPIVVHPERNRQFQADPTLLADYVKEGCLAQITSGSIAGEYGRTPFQTAIRMTEEGWVHFLATDCHDETHRPPGMKAGLRQAEEILGKEGARALVMANPSRLLGLATKEAP
ncbi:MAG: hypothetical protein HQK87_08455 [Nitrospinae bacterium]|nr:hypothetical protein [Nitrospinota bacterium]